MPASSSVALDEPVLDCLYDRELALLERDDQLRVVAGYLDEAADGHGRLVFVSGEAGVGWTSFVIRAVAQAGLARVTVGACDGAMTFRVAAGASVTTPVSHKLSVAGISLTHRVSDRILSSGPTTSPRQGSGPAGRAFD